ncbi:hypothetical protein L3476_13795 [Paenibacillus thiaminolyticus]|uniref:hypothetical protein n=1 Tax=Paenibacillus thiaminolyticus TaxID=49283 RepID=UPI00235033ED|nr:hypothetical protein [Paenibacillus thiaminolyticus]WCR29694.1 hypothetical protein L3476_13795 [Paenibacillus thiaminolyticus]
MVIENKDHFIADAAGMERQNLYGWQVTRGVTKVELNDGTIGRIKEWYGGYFALDNDTRSHVSQITKVFTA